MPASSRLPTRQVSTTQTRTTAIAHSSFPTVSVARESMNMFRFSFDRVPVSFGSFVVRAHTKNDRIRAYEVHVLRATM